LVAPVADDEWGVASAEGDERVRRGAVDASDGISALQVAGGPEDRPGQAVGLVALDQMGDDFGVGLGAKPMPFRRQRFAELPIILDDSVVDDGQLRMAIEVGMSIGVRRPAMGGPPSMAD